MIETIKISAIAVAISGVIGFGTGLGTGAAVTWKFSRNHYIAKIAVIEKDRADEKSAAVGEALLTLKDAQTRGDALFNRLADTEFTLKQKSLELSYALKKSTTGSACLNSASVGLLNNNIGSSAGRVPQAASRPTAEDGAIATDTDVAGWISHATSQYNICRTRLDALIDFEEGK